MGYRSRKRRGNSYAEKQTKTRLAFDQFKTNLVDKVIDAKYLRQNIANYYVKKRLAVHFEVTLNKRGTLRADIITLSMGNFITILEVKSSVQDFRADKKWQGYLQYCDRFFFVMSQDTFDKVKDEIPASVGVMIPFGNVSHRTVRKSKQLEITNDARLEVITRLAYRSATLNLHTHKSKVDVLDIVSTDVVSKLSDMYEIKNKDIESIYDSTYAVLEKYLKV